MQKQLIIYIKVGKDNGVINFKKKVGVFFFGGGGERNYKRWSFVSQKSCFKDIVCLKFRKVRLSSIKY